jgi:hypothetical protein
MRFHSNIASLVVLALAACGSTDPNPSDGSAPIVAITAPVQGATVSGTVSIDVSAFDDFGVDKVRILIDSVLLTELYTAPFHANWNTSSLVDNSTHVIRVEALDVAQNIGTQQINVTVLRGPQ